MQGGGIEETFHINMSKPTYKSRLRNQTSEREGHQRGRYMISKIGVVQRIKERRHEVSCIAFMRGRGPCSKVGSVDMADTYRTDIREVEPVVAACLRRQPGAGSCRARGHRVR